MLLSRCSTSTGPLWRRLPARRQVDAISGEAGKRCIVTRAGPVKVTWLSHDFVNKQHKFAIRSLTGSVDARWMGGGF